MRRRLIHHIINEELLREFELGDVVDAGKNFINNTVVPTANNIIDKGKKFVQDKVVPTVNSVGKLLSQLIGDPLNNAGVYNGIKIPKITGIKDLAKLGGGYNSNTRSGITNGYIELLKEDSNAVAEDLLTSKYAPRIILSTYDVLSKTYVTSHSELKINVFGKSKGAIIGHLNTYIDDADYSLITNNCANATFSCICAALGISISGVMSTPAHVMNWFVKKGAKEIKSTSDGLHVHELRVSLIEALRGLFYIKEYVKLGKKS